MEKEKLEILVDLGKSQRQIGEELNCSQTSIKYWLNKYELKTKHNIHNKQNCDIKFCPRCEKSKPIDDFYKRSNRGDYGGYCKNCSNQYHAERIKKVKLKMIQYKDCKCLDCELKLENTHQCVFDFHHLDPKEKDPNWDKIQYQKWDKIKDELDKCVMLCANCHRIRHSNE